MFPPGEKFFYSNTNLILLGLVVEKASGQALDDYVQEHILDPAGAMATGVLPDGERMVSATTQKQRLITPPTPIPGAGYGLGIFDVRGWIGHNGFLPGYESLTIYLPSAQATLVVVLNTGIDYKNQEPSTLFGDAITRIVSADHVFNLPAQPAAR